MRGRHAAGLAALALVTAACAGQGGDEASLGTGPAQITTVAPTTTSVPPPGPGAFVSRTGVVMPVVSRDNGRWTVTTPCNRTATVSEGTHVPYAAVVLDAGHGGSDPGAVSPSGLRETTVNLAVTQHAKAALEAAGVSVLLTRSAEYDMDLNSRAQIAIAVGARAFVSIHHNAEPDGPWPGPGSETYYQIASPDSKRLSGLIYEEVVRALSQYKISWVADSDAGAKYRQGSRGDYYAVLRLPGSIVSSLVELAFISNPAEAALIGQPEVQRVEGEAVARGIVRYLTTKDAGSGFTEPYPRPTPPGRSPSAPAPCTDPALV